jgi:predicted lactoylglutathione lyase
MRDVIFGQQRIAAMDENGPPARFTVVSLGVSDVRASANFYEALGFVRKARAAGEVVAFFQTGGTVLALYPWDKLAEDAQVPDQPRPQAFRGVTLAWNCNSEAEVDRAMAHALAVGGRLVKPAHPTSYGGYSGYFADPDDHLWEIVVAPGLDVTDTGLLTVPD